MRGRPPKFRPPGKREEILQALDAVVGNFALTSEREKTEMRLGRPVVRRMRPVVEVDELPDDEIEP